MNTPFDASRWQPSKPHEAWETPPSDDVVSALIRQLATQTNAILHHPYDPSSWINRAKTLAQLRYPELAVGDAQKAIMLCRQLLSTLDDRPRFRIGYRMGFCMEDHTDRDTERDEHQVQLAVLQGQAQKVICENLEFCPNYEQGRAVLRPYPWMEEKHMWRGDEVVEGLNEDLRAYVDCPEGRKVPCIVRRYAFGKGVGGRDGEDALGVFAMRDIPQGETIVVDASRTWVSKYLDNTGHRKNTETTKGCNGPGTDGTSSNLFGGLGCMDPLHPNEEADEADQDWRWMRDRGGKNAADAIMKCRFLFCAIQDGAEHPLDHHLIARLTPTYRQNKFRNFWLETDIAILNTALQKFGIDIFANLKWDTWIYFTLMARVDNNTWSDPNTSCVNSLFSMFNHSCEANVEWNVKEDHTTMIMKTSRDVSKGEQLFICYDGFMKDQPLNVRRERFWRWINGPCMCGRCIREEEELKESGASSPANASFSSESSGSWDDEVHPVFPEDEVNWENALLKAQD